MPQIDEVDVHYPAHCVIVNATGYTIAPGLIAQTTDASRPHIGKIGVAECTDGWNVKITLDDGTVLYGHECWWKQIDEEAANATD